MAYVNQAVQSFNPLVAMSLSEASLLNGDSLFIYDMAIGNGAVPATVKMLSPWLVFCLEALIVSAILVLLSIRLVQPAHYKATRTQELKQAQVPAYAGAVPVTGETQPQPPYPNPYQPPTASQPLPPPPPPPEAQAQVPPPPVDPQPSQ